MRKQLVGIRLLATRVDPTPPLHTSRDDEQHLVKVLLSHECKAHGTGRPLTHLLGFAQAVPRILPAAH